MRTLQCRQAADVEAREAKRNTLAKASRVAKTKDNFELRIKRMP